MKFRNRSYNVPSVAKLSQFLVYLFNIKEKSTASHIITDQHTPQVVASFFNYALNKKSQNYNEVELHLKLEFNIIESWEENDYPQDRVAHIGVSNSVKGDKKLCEITTNYKIILGNSSLPYIKLFQSLGNINIDSLTIGNTTEFEPEERIPIVLDTVSDHLTKLKSLHIWCYSQVTFSKDRKVKKNIPPILEKLIFENCELKEKIFLGISERYPNLKKVEITCCTFRKRTKTKLRDDYRLVPIDMPSTCLDELYFLIRIDDCYYDPEQKKVLIRLRTANSKPRYCKLFWEEEDTHFLVPEDGDIEYSICLRDRKCIIYDVYCEAVSKLVVDTEFNGTAIFEEKLN